MRHGQGRRDRRRRHPGAHPARGPGGVLGERLRRRHHPGHRLPGRRAARAAAVLLRGQAEALARRGGPRLRGARRGPRRRAGRPGAPGRRGADAPADPRPRAVRGAQPRVRAPDARRGQAPRAAHALARRQPREAHVRGGLRAARERPRQRNAARRRGPAPSPLHPGRLRRPHLPPGRGVQAHDGRGSLRRGRRRGARAHRRDVAARPPDEESSA